MYRITEKQAIDLGRKNNLREVRKLKPGEIYYHFERISNNIIDLIVIQFDTGFEIQREKNFYRYTATVIFASTIDVDQADSLTDNRHEYWCLLRKYKIGDTLTYETPIINPKLINSKKRPRGYKKGMSMRPRTRYVLLYKLDDAKKMQVLLEPYIITN
jgi:hypothetical protein